MSAHTPGPVSLRGGMFIVGDNPERQIADTNVNESREVNAANAARIALCWNAHDDMLTALVALVDVLVRCDAETNFGQQEQCTDDEWDAALAQGRTAIAKAQP
jgi:hypothetical protein